MVRFALGKAFRALPAMVVVLVHIAQFGLRRKVKSLFSDESMLIGKLDALQTLKDISFIIFMEISSFHIFYIFLVEIHINLSKNCGNRRRGALPGTSGNPTPRRLQEENVLNVDCFTAGATTPGFRNSPKPDESGFLIKGNFFLS